MKIRVLGPAILAGALLMGGALAANPAVRTDQDVAKQLRHELTMYPRFTIWDDLSFHVANGLVELNGAVTQPYKKDDIEHIARAVPGVTSLTDNVKVLPLSDMDNRLRLQVAHAIYGDPTFTKYATMAIPPVHIIVDNGHVTLVGVVANDFEKQIAGTRASSVGLSFGPVVNNLRVENPSPKKS